MRILFVGDIFGRPGRNIVREHLAALVKEHAVDLCIANGENAAGGFGLTPQIAEEFFDLGIDVITTGNHVWDKRELVEYFNAAVNEPYSPARRVLRPANYPAGTPGVGVYEGSTRAGVAVRGGESAGAGVHGEHRRPVPGGRPAAGKDRGQGDLRGLPRRGDFRKRLRWGGIWMAG